MPGAAGRYRRAEHAWVAGEVPTVVVMPPALVWQGGYRSRSLTKSWRMQLPVLLQRQIITLCLFPFWPVKTQFTILMTLTNYLSSNIVYNTLLFPFPSYFTAKYEKIRCLWFDSNGSYQSLYFQRWLLFHKCLLGETTSRFGVLFYATLADCGLYMLMSRHFSWIKAYRN